MLGWLALWYAALLVAERALDDAEASWTEPLSSMIGPLIGIAARASGSGAGRWAASAACGSSTGPCGGAVCPDDADPGRVGTTAGAGAHRFQRRARTFALGFTLLVLVATVLLVAWVGFGWVVVVSALLIGAALVALLEFASRRQSARIHLLRDQLRGLPDRGR